MRVLIVGGGGREHALAWKLAQEAEVHATPGNPGIAQVAQCHPVRAEDHDGIAQLCETLGVGLVVIGPEGPLIAGLADRLRSQGFTVFGPGSEWAQHEGSKAFSKELMRRARVPTADFGVCSSVEEARAFAAEIVDRGRGVAVKASGAALGKGVVVCSSLGEAEDAIEMMMVDKALGTAGDEVVIEERLVGREFSLLSVCSGDSFVSLPVAQDYKRALDGDRGPNTGGMGSYSPVSWLDEEIVRKAEERIVAPMLHEMSDYRGVLFSGVMVVDGEPFCLEYNVRFGDPETQTVVRRIGSGFLDMLLAAARGERVTPVEVPDNAAVTVVMASGGYPGEYEKGKPITIGSLPEGVVVFHAGTAESGVDDAGGLVTAGGRVLAVSAAGASVGEARSIAYEAVGAVEFEGAFYRGDIGDSQ